MSDPVDDGGKNSREIAGTPYPAVYVAADDTNFMVRLRLDADPSQSSSVAPFGWGVLFDTNNNLHDYEFSLIVDGTGNPRSIVFGQNTVQASIGDPSDRIESVLSCSLVPDAKRFRCFRITGPSQRSVGSCGSYLGRCGPPGSTCGATHGWLLVLAWPRRAARFRAAG